jgi:hypothetical protein
MLAARLLLLFCLCIPFVALGRTPDEILRLVGQREDMKPWAGRAPEQLRQWVQKGIRFDSDDDPLVSKFDYAKLVLLANLLKEGRYDRPYLIEGGVYHGFWFESVPVTMQVFARIDLDTAKAQLRQFITHQMADGYLPYKITPTGPGERSIGYGWIAFAAWQLYLLDGDRTFLEAFREPLGRWFAWMDKYRDANHNGIYEAWSPGDVGQDNSARFKGLPLHVENLRIPPKDRPTPYDAPDVSGLMYLEMLSLAEIDDALDHPAEAILWRRRATELRSAVNTSLWDPDSACYYDRDSRGEFVRMVGEVLLRAVNCGLPDTWMARSIFDRHILNPKEFWTPCPLPSFALNEPLAQPGAPNVWSGPVMALTHLRAPYGFEHYGQGRELRDAQRRFLAAVVRSPATFQQYHPVTGEGGAPKSARLYSPTAAFVLDAVGRLYGILPRGGYLEWNAPSTAGSHWSNFEMDLGGSTYRLECKAGWCAIMMDGHRLFSVKGSTTVYTERKGRRVDADLVHDFPRN